MTEKNACKNSPLKPSAQVKTRDTGSRISDFYGFREPKTLHIAGYLHPLGMTPLIPTEVSVVPGLRPWPFRSRPEIQVLTSDLGQRRFGDCTSTTRALNFIGLRVAFQWYLSRVRLKGLPGLLHIPHELHEALVSEIRTGLWLYGTEKIIRRYW